MESDDQVVELEPPATLKCEPAFTASAHAAAVYETVARAGLEPRERERAFTAPAKGDHLDNGSEGGTRTRDTTIMSRVL